MNPDRATRAYVAILHALLTRPGVTLKMINEDHGEHDSFMRECADDLLRMRLIRAEVSHRWEDIRILTPSMTLTGEHNKRIKDRTRYSLPLILEGIIKDHLVFLKRED